MTAEHIEVVLSADTALARKRLDDLLQDVNWLTKNGDPVQALVDEINAAGYSITTLAQTCWTNEVNWYCSLYKQGAPLVAEDSYHHGAGKTVLDCLQTAWEKRVGRQHNALRSALIDNMRARDML